MSYKGYNSVADLMGLSSFV